jgi:hypothetical protein
MRLVSNRVWFGLVGLCFATPNHAQSTVSSDAPIPASEVKYRHPLLRTSGFIAYLLEIPPRHATLMHRHDHDILSVFVSGAKTTSTIYGREPVSDTIPSGESRFRTAGFTHSTRNDDEIVFRSVILEFAQPQGVVRAETATQRYCNEGSTTDCVTEKRQLCTDEFCVTEIGMTPGAVRKASTARSSYAVIPVTHCELSRTGDGPTTVHAYNAGEIEYFDGAGDSWKNSGKAAARVILVSFH